MGRRIDRPNELALFGGHGAMGHMSLVGASNLAEDFTVEDGGADASYALARQLYDERRLRSGFFPTSYFGEAAWDVLLNLYIAYGERRVVLLSDACIASAVPARTGFRWLKELEERGHVVRSLDPLDSRRYHVRLSDAAAVEMFSYLTTVSRLDRPGQ